MACEFSDGCVFGSIRLRFQWASFTMGDAKPTAGSGRGWVPTFTTRLCVIAWSTAVLTELLPRSGIESLCILVGVQATILGLLACLIVGLRFRQGIFLLLLVALSAPTAYFAIVVREILRHKGWSS